MRRPLGALVEVIPGYLAADVDAHGDASHRLFHVGVGRNAGPGQLEVRHHGPLRVSRFRGLRESAHFTVLELATVRMSLEEFGAFVGLHRGIWSVSGPTTR
jgi:hypothetical protein